VGYRPSQGRYDSRGIYPLAASFDVPGPMARTVKDCVALDQMMGGAALPAATLPRLIVDLGIINDAGVEPAIRDNLDKRVSQLAACGASAEYRHVETIARTQKLIRKLGWLGAVEAAQFHHDMLDSPARARVDQRVIKRLDAA